MVIAHTVLSRVYGEDPEGILNFTQGRSAILFATVAGVSLALMSGGRRRLDGTELMQARLAILGRAIVLLFIAGAIAIVPTKISVILASYAFWFILALPALRWSTRTLLVVAACHAVFGQVVAIALATWIPNWELTSQLGTTFVPDLLVHSVYPAFVWMGFVLAGIALGRYGLDNVKALRNIVIVGLLLFVTFAAPFLIQDRSLAPLFGAQSIIKIQESPEAPSDKSTDDPGTEEPELIEPDLRPQLPSEKQKPIIDTSRPVEWEKVLWDFRPHSGTLFENLSSGGLAMATIAGLVLLGRLAWSRFVLWPLTAVGSMALTSYVLHILVIQGSAHHADELWLAGGLCLGLVVLCGLWKQVFTAGPLEQLTGAVADRLAGRPTKRPH